MQSSAPNLDHDARWQAQVGYVGELRPLVGLQAFAVAWVVLNQFRDHPIPLLGAAFGLVAKGYLGAALFFVVAGFQAAHLYWRATQQRRFSYLALLRRTLIQLYPLQLAATLAMVVLVVTSKLAGAPMAHAPFRARDLIPHFLLLQAWGLLPTDTWNFPTWFASAVWFAAIASPVACWLTLSRQRSAPLVVAAALAVFWAGFALAASRGVLFTDMTAQIGALQTVPAFLLGAGLYSLGLRRSLPDGWAPWLALASVAWVVTAATLRLSDALIWPAFGPLAFAAAETAKSPKPWLAGALGIWLGRRSVAIFLFYLPADIVYFHALKLVFGPPTSATAWLELAGAFPATLVAGAIAHRLITAPSRHAFHYWRRAA